MDPKTPEHQLSYEAVIKSSGDYELDSDSLCFLIYSVVFDAVVAQRKRNEVLDQIRQNEREVRESQRRSLFSTQLCYDAAWEEYLETGKPVSNKTDFTTWEVLS